MFILYVACVDGVRTFTVSRLESAFEDNNLSTEIYCARLIESLLPQSTIQW